MRVAMVIVLIALLLAIIIGAGFVIKPLLATMRKPAPPIPPPTIASVEEFEEALQERCLILHLDVDWAMQAIQSRAAVGELQRSLAADPKYSHVVVRRIDLTEQSGSIWNEVTRWLGPQADSLGLMYGGNGAVVWVKSGHVVSSVPSAYLEGERRLISRTRRLMATE